MTFPKPTRDPKLKNAMNLVLDYVDLMEDEISIPRDKQ